MEGKENIDKALEIARALWQEKPYDSRLASLLDHLIDIEQAYWDEGWNEWHE